MPPISAPRACLPRNVYGEPKRAWAITAEAEKTIASPTTTSESVVKKSHLSTPTRLAIRLPGSFQLCSRRKKMFLHEFLKDAAAMLVVLKLVKARAGRRKQNHVSGARSISGSLDS